MEQLSMIHWKSTATGWVVTGQKIVLRETVLLLLLPGRLPAGRQVCKVLHSRALPCLGSQWPGWNCAWPSIRGAPLKPSHWVSWRRGGRMWGHHQSRSEKSSICSGTRLKKKRYLFLSLILFEPCTLLSCKWCPSWENALVPLGTVITHTHKRLGDLWSHAIFWVWKSKSSNNLINCFSEWIRNNSREFTTTCLSLCLCAILGVWKGHDHHLVYFVQCHNIDTSHVLVWLFLATWPW